MALTNGETMSIAGFKDGQIVRSGQYLYKLRNVRNDKTMAHADYLCLNDDGKPRDGKREKWKRSGGFSYAHTFVITQFDKPKKTKKTENKPCKFMSRPLAKGEPTFTLVGRDPCAALAIAIWAQLRCAAGLNERGDEQIRHAVKDAEDFVDYIKTLPEKAEQIASVIKTDKLCLLRMAIS